MMRALNTALAAGAVLALLALVTALGATRLPGHQQGYTPEQPIEFSHLLHAGELEMDCLYCHHGAETSRHAGLPAASMCMNCHRFVTAPISAIRAEDQRALAAEREPEPVISPELAKLYDALAVDPLSGEALPLVVSVHTVVSFDFAVSILPGWHTTIFPPYFVAGAPSSRVSPWC